MILWNVIEIWRFLCKEFYRIFDRMNVLFNIRNILLRERDIRKRKKIYNCLTVIGCIKFYLNEKEIYYIPTIIYFESSYNNIILSLSLSLNIIHNSIMNILREKRERCVQRLHSFLRLNLKRNLNPWRTTIARTVWGCFIWCKIDRKFLPDYQKISYKLIFDCHFYDLM